MSNSCDSASRELPGGIPLFSQGSKRVVVGVCAGVAAYKTPVIVRRLREAGCDVRVVPTPSSVEMVGLATWEALTGHPAYLSVMQGATSVAHVHTGTQADLLLIAPATANTIAKLAIGMADNLLTATALVATCPVLIAPAMHTQMWDHPATQHNIRILRERGVHVIGPESGRLTGADSGVGRMSEPEAIAGKALSILSDIESISSRAHGPLSGVNVLISAGGTREAIDPVRFIGNRSTGRMGVALANAAADAGACVVLVAANIEQEVLNELTSEVCVCAVSSTAQLRDMMHTHAKNSDVIIMNAAVSDYQPAYCESKIKKDHSGVLSLKLQETPDILYELAHHRTRNDQMVIGFAAETGDHSHSVLEYGKKKAAAKGADMIVVNRVGNTEGFGDVDTGITIIDPDGHELAHSRGSKPAVACTVIDTIVKHLLRWGDKPRVECAVHELKDFNK